MRFLALFILGTALAGCAGHTPAPQTVTAAPAEPTPVVRQHEGVPAAPNAVPAALRERLDYEVPERWSPAGITRTQGMIANYIIVDDANVYAVAVVAFNTGDAPMKDVPRRVAREIADEKVIMANTTVEKSGLRAGFDWRMHAIDEDGVNAGRVELVKFPDRPALTLAFIGYWPRAKNAQFAPDLKRMADTVRVVSEPRASAAPAGPDGSPELSSDQGYAGDVPIPYVPSRLRPRGGNRLLADGSGLHVDLTKGWTFDFASGDCAYTQKGEKIGSCRMMLLPREDLTPFDQATMFANISRDRNDVRTTSDPVKSKDGQSATFNVVYLVPNDPTKVRANGFVEVRIVPNAWPEEFLLCAGNWRPDHPELEVAARRICRSIRPSTPVELSPPRK